MKRRQVCVTFSPSGRTVHVLSGTKMLEAAARAGLTIETPCGGAGTCGKCRVKILENAPEPVAAEQEIYTKQEISEGWRLACQVGLRGDAKVHVPESSLFGDYHQIFLETKREPTGEVHPAVRKIYVELSPPTLDDSEADLMRLQNRIGPIGVDITMLRRLPALLRQNDFKGTAVVANNHLIEFEPGDTRKQCYGLAFDVGTTTLVGSLLDLCNGEEVAVISRMNPQVSFGGDVMTRIEHATISQDGQEELRGAVVGALSEITCELCNSAGIECLHIYEATVAGNTTMEHLLCGIDVGQLGQVPFVPAYADGLVVPASELSLKINPRAASYLFPIIGGFVGGDAVAGILATHMTTTTDATLLVDIGTNGEIVLWHDGRMWAASTAAGPAFEGAKISCGMTAARGAIAKVVFDDDVNYSVIGDVEPTGICGSAIVDLMAELLAAGIVTQQGRLLPAEELPDELPDALKRRVGRDDNGQTHFVLAEDMGATSPPLTFKQRDVREVQLATGAIRAGVNILLELAGLEISDVKRVHLAGGFGSFIRRSNAQRIGLLPAGIDHNRINYVGNASLNGARLALVSTKDRNIAEELARMAEHVQLSQDPRFQMRFSEAMLFPSE